MKLPASTRLPSPSSAARAIRSRSARGWASAPSAGWATRAGSPSSASISSRSGPAGNRRCATGTRWTTSSSTCSRARSCSSPTTASRCCGPGMCAGYPAGKKDAHHFVNRSAAPATYLEVGNRIEGDNAFYPDDDLMWGEDENGVVRRAQGRPPLLIAPCSPHGPPDPHFVARRLKPCVATAPSLRSRTPDASATPASGGDTMAEFPAPNAPGRTRSPTPPVSGALLAYALFGAAAVVGAHLVRASTSSRR